MLGGYLEFFMKPAIAEMYQSLRRELDELIQNKVSESLKKSYLCLSRWVLFLYPLWFLFNKAYIKNFGFYLLSVLSWLSKGALYCFVIHLHAQQENVEFFSDCLAHDQF